MLELWGVRGQIRIEEGWTLLVDNAIQSGQSNNLSAMQRGLLENIAADQQRQQIVSFNSAMPGGGLTSTHGAMPQPTSPGANPYLLQRLLQQQQQQQLQQQQQNNLC